MAKNILAPLRITAAAAVTDSGIQKKIHGSGTTTLLISNEEINDQTLKDSNILLDRINKTIENETKEQKGAFLQMLLGTSEDNLFGNRLSE